MNDTTVIRTPRASEADVLDYVGAVRAWLGDLPPEEVDDLTAGMEADLAERAAESGARLGDLLGEPEAYASELRAAAGLPPRSTHSRYEGARRGVVTEVASALRAVGGRTLERSPWLRDLRPVWWVARGAALGGVLAVMLGGGGVLLMLLGASVSFGVGRMLAAREVGTGSGTFVALVNVVAALALLPVAVWVLDTRTEYVDGASPYGSGLRVAGDVVRNLYVYDAAGNRVEGARLFDHFGQPVGLDPSVVPLVTGPDGEAVAWPPDGGTLSVFPVRSSGTDPWAGEPESWVPPLSITPLPEQASPEPSPSPTPTSSPTPAPTPS